MKSNFVLAFLFLFSLHARAGGGSSVGPGNPSWDFCTQKGGYAYATSGSDGVCKIDQAIVGLWTLYYHMNGSPELASSAFLNKSGEPEMGSSACSRLGGSIEFVSIPDLNYFGYELCVFDENGHLSMISANTLGLGPSMTGNTRLTSLLRGLCR